MKINNNNNNEDQMKQKIEKQNNKIKSWFFEKNE